MSEAPYVFTKHREGITIKRSIRLARYWRHKETGNVVEIRTVQNVVPDQYLRVVFFDPQIGQEISMPLKSRPHPFQPPGAAKEIMEPGFEESFEPYGNFSSRV
jgi:hypothetical protein